jgi:uncharacterized protein with GYD domain
MVTYVVLTKFTDQGIRNAKDSPKNGEDVRSDHEGHLLDAGTV